MFRDTEQKPKSIIHYEFEFKFEVEEEKGILNFLW